MIHTLPAVRSAATEAKPFNFLIWNWN